jgi:predicted O-methyltransferase YrrM
MPSTFSAGNGKIYPHGNMYAPLQLAVRFAQYYLTSANSRGHGVHSPFVFDFITNVLRDKRSFYCYTAIEQLRTTLLHDHHTIEVEDFGAGSAVIKTRQRKVSAIAASSLKSKKYGQLLFRIVQYYQPATIIELGTSFGITTAYLASGHPQAKVFTCEGAPAIAAIAQQQFDALGLHQVTLITGDFTHTLPHLLQEHSSVDLAYIDGNHRRQPTLDYFEQLLAHTHDKSILIFDDIHWSREMEEAWAIIQKHPAVTLSIDLFFIGLVFVSRDFREKQVFTIRF